MCWETVDLFAHQSWLVHLQ